MKSQEVRVLDVLVLGPLMMLFASRSRPLTAGERQVLWWIGLGTVVYNGVNYLSQQARDVRLARDVQGAA